MTTVNVEEQIKMLIELQGLDGEIFDKKRILNSLPERVKELDDALEQKSANLKSLEEESKKLQLKRKEKESELDAKEQGIKKYQAQLFQVKTNKEYTALEKEIAGIKADNSLLEEDIIRLLDQTEALQGKIAEEKKILEGEKLKADEEKKKIGTEKNTVESEYNDLAGKRKNFVSGIDRKILDRYERILRNKDGLAMVPIAGGACGGCNMNLPPQVINEARLKSDIVICGNCARILYWPE